MVNEFQGEAELRWAEKISGIMDSKFTFPGTKIKFGLDPIMGLVPGLGNLFSFSISGFLVYTMAKYGASRKVIIKMLINITLDALLGSIPVIGSIFDFFFKANSKNVKLLKTHYEEGKYQGSGWEIIATIGFIFLSILSASAYGIYKLIEFVVHLF